MCGLDPYLGSPLFESASAARLCRAERGGPGVASGSEPAPVRWSPWLHHLPRVADLARDRRRRRREWAGQERAPARPLPPLEVPVAGADRVLPGLELVAVHRDAHGAAGLAPVGAGLAEHAVQALGLGGLLH